MLNRVFKDDKMLQRVYIKNLAVIDELEVCFESGLNVLTGETGAGKSIIIDALSAIMGNRISTDVIRAGEKLAVIEAEFRITQNQMGPELQAVFGEQGIEISSHEILIRREIHSTGRSRVFVDDQNVNLTFIKNITPYLIELHMQGEQQSLSGMRAQLDLLDEYAGCLELRNKVGVAFSGRQKLLQQLEVFRAAKQEVVSTRDYLQFQLSEIENVSPAENEDAELMGEKTLLSNAEKITELENLIYQKLYEDDDSLLSHLTFLRRHLQALSELDQRMAPNLEIFDNANLMLTEVAESLRSINISDYSPERLNYVETRLAQIEHLKRKYGGSLADVLATQNAITEKLGYLETSADTEVELISSVHNAEKQFSVAAKELSQKRRKAAKELSGKVTLALAHIALPRASFEIVVTSANLDPTPQEDEDDFVNQPSSWSARGIDRVHFYFNANAGEEKRPLGQVASGGELSRLLLVLREVCRGSLSRETSSINTLIFDEIDVGISGRVAETVGRKLSNLARSQQVLCVTHQPQIARFADTHYSVFKTESDGRTKSFVHKLDYEERVKELAGLIAADEDLPTARQTAEWLLKTAHKVDTVTATLEKPADRSLRK